MRKPSILTTVFIGMINLLLGSTLISVATAQTFSTVPFLYEDARIYVPVSSKAGSLGLFILDTGVSDALFDDDVRKKLGLTIVSAGEERGAGRATVKTASSGAATVLVHKTQLRLAESRFAPLTETLSPYCGRKVSGIIGGAFFREHVVTIDVTRHEIGLRDPATFRYQGEGYVLHFQFVNGVPIAEGRITLPDGDTLALKLLIDLGAKANLLLSEPFVSQNRLLERATPSIVEPLGAGIGGETRYAFTRMPRLVVGSETGPSITDFVAGLSVEGTLRGGFYDGLLGLEFLKHYRVTFDYPHQQIIFEAKKEAGEDGFDESGLFLIAGADKQGFVVRYVVPASPAANAGIGPGDVVRRINGRPVGAFTLAQVRSILRGEAGAFVALRVKRQNQIAEIRVTLRRLL